MDEFDVVVLGGGPGGYVAAIRAAQLKLRTALIERDAVGGICLNWGCIPSKSLIRNAEVLSLFHRAGEFGIEVDGYRADYGHAVDRSRGVVDRMVKGVQFLLRKHGVELIRGTGILRSHKEIEVSDGRRVRAKHVVLATGARPRALPSIEMDGRCVIASHEALERRERPKSVVIVGAGPVGMEFAYVWRTYGAEVTVVEALPHVLPQEDEEIAAVVAREFGKSGIAIVTDARVTAARTTDAGAVVDVETPTGSRSFTAEQALIGIGVQANSDGLGLDALGVAVERSFVTVDDRMATNVPGVYAIGDLTGPPLLAHVASAQGVSCVEHIAGLQPPALDYEQMPRATYCEPEVASIGLTEQTARERGFAVAVGHFPYRANGRALASAEPEGLAKVVADKRTGDLLGFHIAGYMATELLGELSLARFLEATPGSVGYTVHAHPTLSEVVKEAALSARGEVIHVWQG